MENQRVDLRKLAHLSVVVSLASVILTGPLSAQTTDNDFSLGVGGGFARGFGSPYTYNTIGYYMLSTLEIPSPLRVLRPRADLLFADWGSSHVTSLTGNLVFAPVSIKRVKPYVLAGAGAYATPGSDVSPGWTLGMGLRLPGEGRTIVIESRVHAFRGSPPNNPPYQTGSTWRNVWTPIGLSIQF